MNKIPYFKKVIHVIRLDSGKGQGVGSSDLKVRTSQGRSVLQNFRHGISGHGPHIHSIHSKCYQSHISIKTSIKRWYHDVFLENKKPRKKQVADISLRIHHLKEKVYFIEK